MEWLWKVPAIMSLGILAVALTIVVIVAAVILFGFIIAVFIGMLFAV